MTGNNLDLNPSCKLFNFVQITDLPELKLQNTFIFILCPPYTGSTLLVKLLNSSTNLSLNNYKGTCEGQKLEELGNMYSNGGRWDPDFDPNWEKIKLVWMDKWDLSKKYLLEKSPPNLIRAESISHHFSGVKFILLIRDPFALCDSLLERNKFSIEQCSKMVMKFFRHQYSNYSKYADALLIRYEDLTMNTDLTLDRITQHFPGIGQLTVESSYDIHNSSIGASSSIINTNKHKIARLTDEQLNYCRNEFMKEKILFQSFGYILD